MFTPMLKALVSNTSEVKVLGVPLRTSLGRKTLLPKPETHTGNCPGASLDSCCLGFDGLGRFTSGTQPLRVLRPKTLNIK